MFNQSTDYALSAMAQLAAGGSEYQTTGDVVAVTGAPLMYLQKIFKLLSRAGLVSTLQGRGGGLKLSRPASKISLLDVVDAMDPLKRLPPMGDRNAMAPLNRQVDAIVGEVRKRLASISLADVASRGRS